MRYLALLISLLFPPMVPPIITPPQTAEPLTTSTALILPPEVKPTADRRTTEITATTEGKRVDWELPEAVDGYTPVYPVDVFATPDGKTIKFPTPTKPGRYVFRAYTAVKEYGAFAKTVVVVPGPAPTPAPPAPPAPTDAFKADLSKALAAAPPEERNQAAILAAAYRAAAKECKGPAASLADLVDLITMIINDKEQGVGPNVLKPVRDRVKVELASKVPNLEAELTDAARAAAADVYTKAADVLEAK